jgi:hypothetical protein
MRCGVCRKRVLEDLQAGRDLEGGLARLHICDCCHRCFHEQCCLAKGIALPGERALAAEQQEGEGEGEGGEGGEGQAPWFHSQQCAQVSEVLGARAAAGALPLDESRTLELVPCRSVGRQRPDMDALTEVGWAARQQPPACAARAPPPPHPRALGAAGAAGSAGRQTGARSCPGSSVCLGARL